ncbi:MAG TPA: GFA family protein [Gammaproteobacteria bacterium]
MSTKGSCLCGEVRFEIEGAFESFFLCHCEYCRKDTGSAHASNLFSTKASLNWLSGLDMIKIYTVPGTRHVKSFCTSCGSALPNVQMDGSLIVVPAGSLDDKIPIKPSAHIFVSSKADWDEGLENVQKIEGLPT